MGASNTHHVCARSCGQWSVGVVLYSMVSGRRPFAGDSDEDVKGKIISCAVEYPYMHFNTVSAGARDLLSKLLCPAGERLTAPEALEHPWIKVRVRPEEERVHAVYL